tara:strand:+ start:443 stop:991 length:549 start_codon:yes stop_codon:yes gene_type:complete
MVCKVFLALLCVITLTNCTDQFSAVQQMNRFDEIPVGITEELHLIYSDSAQIEAELIAPINIDYTNQNFPYSEFPQGLDATLFGNRGEVTYVRSDYGIYYPKTEIIDLRGNVEISDNTGTKLNTNQLYWDAGQEWLFTEKNFTFTNASYDIEAVRLDANRSFRKLMTGMISGNIQVKDEGID